mgnify:CR=1 FL=1
MLFKLKCELTAMDVGIESRVDIAVMTLNRPHDSNIQKDIDFRFHTSKHDLET